MNATISFRDYLSKEKDFFIPNYQRGYVWGRKRKGNAKDSVTYILESLLEGYKVKREIFIQGVTVSETDSDIVLIDGQQRTTFFYLLLKYLGYQGKFVIKYGIRKESNEFLSKKDLVSDCEENPDEEFQDIFFFKKTIRIISNKISDFSEQDKQEFCDYVLDFVKFLYIDIPENKATKVFSMMNGNKAEMKTEELIKAELLRLASLNSQDLESKTEKEKNAIEWDNNLLRSRYAREWDKWLQWWNRDDVKSFYQINNVMGLLIATFQDKACKELSFSQFKTDFLSKQMPIEAKRIFDGLRRLQKRFEDAFNKPVVYNKIGAIIRVGDKDSFIQWYFGCSKYVENLDKYYRLAFLRLTHKEIVEELQNGGESEIFNKKYSERFKELSSDNLYNDYPEEAFRLLLRLNIDEDNKQENNKQEDGKGRKFDFSIWDRNDSRGRSLEHIFPKSKVLHKEKGNNGHRETVNGKGDKLANLPADRENYIARCTCRCFIGNERFSASEHSIGNLVLLYKNDNSSFNDSSFSDKKKLFFKAPDSKNVKEIFKSRHLLHTIYKFANSEWTGRDIAQNKYQTLNDFKAYYGK